MSLEEHIGKWSYTTDGKVFSKNGKELGSYTRKYARISTKYGTLSLSRVLWFMHYGKWPDGEIDHIDGDTHNNSLDNLRDCGRKENSKNRRSYKNSFSKYKGVFKQRNGFVASIRNEGVVHYLGYFSSEEEAALAYNEACLFYHGDYASLNKIED